MILPRSDNQEILRILQTQIEANDETAFRRLFDLYASRLAYFASLIVKNRSTAQEIVDDVFVKIWKNRHQLTKIDNLKVYLYTSVKNASLNFIEKKANELVTQPFDYVDFNLRTNEDPCRAMENNEVMRQIDNAIEGLPPRCKMVFKLVRQDGLRYREVAQILNISENTVDAQMVIAVRRISQQVQLDALGVSATALKK